MHRPSVRQAELDARVLRERRIGQRLLDMSETYTTLGRRPGRALLGGLVVSLVVAMVVAVISVAGATRAAQQRQEQASNTSATTVVTATTAPTWDGEVPTSISVSSEAAACAASHEEIAIVPLFTQEGLLERIELTSLPPGCVGREMLLSVLGLDGVELDSQELAVEQAGSLSVGDWSQEQPVRREEISEILVEIL
jgi:hypothetical protein